MKNRNGISPCFNAVTKIEGLKLPAHRAGLPGKVISFYIVSLNSAYTAGLAGHIPVNVFVLIPKTSAGLWDHFTDTRLERYPIRVGLPWPNSSVDHLCPLLLIEKGLLDSQTA